MLGEKSGIDFRDPREIQRFKLGQLNHLFTLSNYIYIIYIYSILLFLLSHECLLVPPVAMVLATVLTSQHNKTCESWKPVSL